MRRLIVGAALIVALVGCGGKDDLQGDIVSKEVKAGYDFIYQMPISHQTCTGGKYNTCSTYYTYIPIWYHVPECYQITVEGPTSGSTCIDEDKWTGFEVGDQYVGPDVDPKDLKVKKED